MGLTFDAQPLLAASGLASTETEALSLWDTAGDTSFPGALLPARSDDGFAIYAIAETAVEWRRLQALLVAFAGPTLTDFSGVPFMLDATRPFEALLVRNAPHATARLRPGSTPQLEAWTLATLRRLRARLEDAPNLSIARPDPTSRLLARLRDALNASDFAEAWLLHASLRVELRLDALNLLHLEMLILAESGRWTNIREHDRFAILCRSDPPAATAAILLGAITRVDLGDLSEEDPRTHVAWLSVAHLALPLLRIASSKEPEIERLRGFADPMPPAPADASETTVIRPANGDIRNAVAALIATDADREDPVADDEARRAVEGLPTNERERLLGKPHLRGLWSGLEDRSGGAPIPRNWVDWVGTLATPSVPAMEHARRGQDDWVMPDADVDPAEAFVLAEAILSIPDGLAGERFCEALPYIVKWAQNDPRWPRSTYARVYVAALMRTALGSRRGDHALRSIAILLEGALSCGLDADEYRDALDAVGEIARVGLSAKSADAALDLLDVARLTTAVDEDVLARFAHALLAELDRLHESLDAGQRLLIAQVGARFGRALVVSIEPTVGGELFRSIGKLAVGVYTLTEAAGRQAKDLLEAAAPGVKVLLNHDHVGTAPLAAMARNVDLLVIVSASAKHAATDFIRSKRGTRPLIFAAGRGATSVIRAVQGWIAATS